MKAKQVNGKWRIWAKHPNWLMGLLYPLIGFYMVDNIERSNVFAKRPPREFDTKEEAEQRIKELENKK